jgi:hypothetical protein
MLFLISFTAQADVAKARMRVCTTDLCRNFVSSAEIFKRRYCRGDEKQLNYRLNCYQSVDRKVHMVMKESKFPNSADQNYWGKLVKEGEINVPASSRSSF